MASGAQLPEHLQNFMSQTQGMPQPPTHMPPMQNPQFGMAQGSQQGQPQYQQPMGANQGYRMASDDMGQDPYGYMTPQMGQLMKFLKGYGR